MTLTAAMSAVLNRLIRTHMCRTPRRGMRRAFTREVRASLGSPQTTKGTYPCTADPCQRMLVAGMAAAACRRQSPLRGPLAGAAPHGHARQLIRLYARLRRVPSCQSRVNVARRNKMYKKSRRWCAHKGGPHVSGGFARHRDSGVAMAACALPARQADQHYAAAVQPPFCQWPP